MSAQTSAIIADRDTWKGTAKRSGGKYLQLIAIQKSRRTSRKGRTKYVYHLEGTNTVFWNRSRNGVIFFPFGYDVRTNKLYHDVFVAQPLTEKEKVWLARYNYELVK